MSYFLFVVFMAVVGLLNAQTPPSRTVFVVNNCKESFYFDITSGAAPFNPPGLGRCTSNANCIAGAYCDTVASVCYWNNPVPDNGNYVVNAGDSNSITFPFVNNGNPLHWSGKFGFCYNQSCSASPSVCLQQGCSVVYGPSNIPEITMQKQGVDFYDISNIGGINVAMSFGPNGVGASDLVATDPYMCGTPGSTTSVNSITGSSWSLVPPLIQNIWVMGSGKTCSTNADCSGSQVCGLSNVPGRTPMFQMTCGDFYGYWSANAICAQDPQQSLTPNPFNCATPVQNGPYATTLSNLYRCEATSGSGYSTNANPYVCGCVDWWKITNGLVPKATTNCTASNPIWTASVLPTISWIKAACPSCYTYPYDDMSSTFVCSDMVNSYNTQDYTITLCPAH